MSFFSLEEAIACPPPLTSDSSMKSRENKPEKMDVSDSNSHCTKNSSSRRTEDVLSRWSERASIQAFMNALSSLSALKQQQLQQQQKLHEQIKQKVQQQLQEQLLKKKQEQLQQQKQQAQLQKQMHQHFQLPHNLFNSDCSLGDSLPKSLLSKPGGLLTDAAFTLSQSQNSHDVNIQGSCQRRQKVKKVMKGGVLISMPSSARQQTGVKSSNHINTEEKTCVPFGSYKEKVVNYGTGNILEDILARTQDSNQGNFNDSVMKTQKKASKLLSTEKVESNSDAISKDVSSDKDKTIYMDEKLVGFTKSVESSILGHCSTTAETRTNSGAAASRSLTEKVKPSCGVVTGRGGKTGSGIKSINVMSSAVMSSKENEENNNKVSLTKKKVQTFKSLGGNTHDKKRAPVTPCIEPTENKSENAGKLLFESVKEVTTHKAAKTSKPNDTCQVNTSLEIASDTESADSDALVVDVNTSQDYVNKSCKKSFERARNESFTSESSDDLHVPSSFDRIRAWQFNTCTTNEVLISPTDDVAKSLIESYGKFGGDEESTQQDLREEVDINIKVTTENMLTDNAGNSKTLSLNGNVDIAAGQCMHHRNYFTRTTSPKKEQLNSDDHLDKFLVGMETTTGKLTVNQISTTTQGGFSSGQFLEKSMGIHKQNPGILESVEKTVDLKENEGKRNEQMGKTGLIETKRKRTKRNQKANNAIKTGQKKGGMNIRSSIKTKRKRTGKNNRSNKPQVDYKGCITRSMSQGDVRKLPQSLKTLDKRKAKHSPDHKEAAIIVEKAEIEPTLLSMVSGEALDITVTQEELQGKQKRTRGGVKKKKNKITEWFKRQQKMEREKLKRGGKTLESKTYVCPFYLKARCSKGAVCEFRHEKTTELCRFYVAGACNKLDDGMCPNLHGEFPCMFFHKKQFCRNGEKCRFSHEPLTEKTREMLDKHVKALEVRKNEAGGDLFSPADVQQGTDTPGTNKSLNEKNENVLHKEVTETWSAENNNRSLKPTRENTRVPVKLDAEVPPTGISNQMQPTATLKLPSPTHSSSKPKVKRLCSLSSYKPQILSSFVGTIIKSAERSGCDLPVESKTSDFLQMNADETQGSMTKFLPGMFKER